MRVRVADVHQLISSVVVTARRPRWCEFGQEDGEGGDRVRVAEVQAHHGPGADRAEDRAGDGVGAGSV